MSGTHCRIEWDGKEATSSAVIVTDLDSHNNTYINGNEVGKGKSKLLHDWSILSFGPPKECTNPKQDYRFMFRHRATKESPADSIRRFYDVECVLGSGAFGTVLKALHIEEHKWYAIKSFPGARAQEPLGGGSRRPSRERRTEIMQSAWKHLEREVEVLKKLRHRNICQLKETFMEAGDSISIVLEYVDGGDLSAYINKHDAIFEIEAQNITYQICDALIYIHSMGVVHRDLKPENVLLTLHKPPLVKVADFGLAQVMKSMHSKCGTPGYFAPEILKQGPRGYDKSVDSWSLGVLVFVMLAKDPPFHDDESTVADWNLLKGFNVSTDGEDFLRKLLEVDPGKRMSPKDARSHVWLSTQDAKERVRSIESELSRRSLASRTPPRKPRKRPRPLQVPPAPSDGEADPLCAGAKRKASVLGLGKTLSTLSVSDTDRPPAKRARGDADAGSAETVVPKLYRPTPPPRVVWMAKGLKGDEVPGLGMWRGSSNG
ncbi:hypothetical protein V8D89_004903, partial [Ganoderma adspersum]